MFPLTGGIWPSSPHLRTQCCDQEQDLDVKDEHFLRQLQLLPLYDDLQDTLQRVATGHQGLRHGTLEEEIVQAALGFVDHQFGVLVQRLSLGHWDYPGVGKQLGDGGGVDEVVQLSAVTALERERERDKNILTHLQ